MRDGITSEERDRRKALERENKELRRANEILKLASVFLPMPTKRVRILLARYVNRA